MTSTVAMHRNAHISAASLSIKLSSKFTCPPLTIHLLLWSDLLSGSFAHFFLFFWASAPCQYRSRWRGHEHHQKNAVFGEPSHWACASDNGLAQSSSINTRASLRLLCVDTIIIPSLKGSLVNYGNKTAWSDTPHGLGTCKTQLQSQSKRKHKHKTEIHFLKNVEKKKKKENAWPQSTGLCTAA